MLIGSLAAAGLIVMVLVALISAGPIFWGGLLLVCTGVALVMERLKLHSGTGARKWVSIFGTCAAIAAVVIFVRVSMFFDDTFAPTKSAGIVQKQVDELLKKHGEPQRFSKALALAKTVDVVDWQRRLTQEIFLAYSAVPGGDPIAEPELDIALTLARQLNRCPSFVPPVAVRRMQPAHMAELLQSIPQSGPDEGTCASAQTELLRLVGERCTTEWWGRCRQELPREQLIALAASYDESKPLGGLRKSQLGSFNRSIWKELDSTLR